MTRYEELDVRFKEAFSIFTTKCIMQSTGLNPLSSLYLSICNSFEGVVNCKQDKWDLYEYLVYNLVNEVRGDSINPVFTFMFNGYTRTSVDTPKANMGCIRLIILMLVINGNFKLALKDIKKDVYTDVGNRFIENGPVEFYNSTGIISDIDDLIMSNTYFDNITKYAGKTTLPSKTVIMSPSRGNISRSDYSFRSIFPDYSKYCLNAVSNADMYRDKKTIEVLYGLLFVYLNNLQENLSANIDKRFKLFATNIVNLDRTTAYIELSRHDSVVQTISTYLLCGVDSYINTVNLLHSIYQGLADTKDNVVKQNLNKFKVKEKFKSIIETLCKQVYSRVEDYYTDYNVLRVISKDIEHDVIVIPDSNSIFLVDGNIDIITLKLYIRDNNLRGLEDICKNLKIRKAHIGNVVNSPTVLYTKLLDEFTILDVLPLDYLNDLMYRNSEDITNSLTNALTILTQNNILTVFTNSNVVTHNYYTDNYEHSDMLVKLLDTFYTDERYYDIECIVSLFSFHSNQSSNVSINSVLNRILPKNIGSPRNTIRAIYNGDKIVKLMYNIVHEDSSYNRHSSYVRYIKTTLKHLYFTDYNYNQYFSDVLLILVLDNGYRSLPFAIHNCINEIRYSNSFLTEDTDLVLFNSESKTYYFNDTLYEELYNLLDFIASIALEELDSISCANIENNLVLKLKHASSLSTLYSLEHLFESIAVTPKTSNLSNTISEVKENLSLIKERFKAFKYVILKDIETRNNRNE